MRIMKQALHRAQVAIQSGSSENASVALSQAAAYAPWRYDLWEQAGILALKAGKAETAKSYLEQVRTKQELSAEGMQTMGDILDFEGDLRSAILYWENAQNAGSENLTLHWKLASAYRQLGYVEAAIQQLKMLLERGTGDAYINYNLGLLLAASDPEAAPAYLTLAAELNPELSSKSQEIIGGIRSARRAEDQAYLFTSSGQALAAIEEWDLAAYALSKAVEFDPDFAEAWAYLGEAYQQINQGGFNELNKALELDPNSVVGNLLMALYWQRHDKFGLALINLHTAANQNPQNPVLQAEIGNTLALLGNFSAAEIHYQRAVDLAPRDPKYWQVLANFYIKYDLDLRESGLSAARQAVILAPEDASSLDVMAQVYILLDHPLIARRFLARAIEADPVYAPAQLHLGIIYLMEGKNRQAYQQLTFAKSLAPENSQTAEQARRLLESNFP